MRLTPEQLTELRDAALGATPQDIDTAETIDTAKDGGRVIDCPVCNGDGYAALEGEYCNYDSAAIGVQFYGIGNEHGAAERYFRAARPETVLQLLAHIDAQHARIADLELALFAENQKRQEVEQQRGQLCGALELMLERTSEPPEANCSCHLSPPCNDCIDYGGEREAFEFAKDAIATVRGETP